jgi:hypothetical protein
MANDKGLPELTDGALYLLRAARDNDTHRALAKNAALLAVLEFGEELIRACREKKPAALASLLSTKKLPSNFLAITVAILHRVDERMNAAMHEEGPRVPVVSDYNRHVLQGFAEALADAAWRERAAQDFDGPPLKTVVSELARHDVNTLWMRTLQHYLANVLQDLFAALRIREEVTDLEPTAEVDLRSIDALAVATYAMQIAAETSGEDTASPAIIAFSLDRAIDDTLGRPGAR